MADTSDHLHRLDEATFYLPDATDDQRDAARRYLTRNGAGDLLAVLGLDGVR